MADRLKTEKITWPANAPYSFSAVMIRLARNPIQGTWKNIKPVLALWEKPLTTITGMTGKWISAAHAISQGRTNVNVNEILKGFNSDSVMKAQVQTLFETELGNMKVSDTSQVVQSNNSDAGSYVPSISGDSKSSVGSNLSFGNINMGPGVKSALNTFA